MLDLQIHNHYADKDFILTLTLTFDLEPQPPNLAWTLMQPEPGKERKQSHLYLPDMKITLLNFNRQILSKAPYSNRRAMTSSTGTINFLGSD